MSKALSRTSRILSLLIAFTSSASTLACRIALCREPLLNDFENWNSPFGSLMPSFWCSHCWARTPWTYSRLFPLFSDDEHEHEQVGASFSVDVRFSVGAQFSHWPRRDRISANSSDCKREWRQKVREMQLWSSCRFGALLPYVRYTKCHLALLLSRMQQHLFLAFHRNELVAGDLIELLAWSLLMVSIFSVKCFYAFEASYREILSNQFSDCFFFSRQRIHNNLLSALCHLVPVPLNMFLTCFYGSLSRP